MAMIGLELVDAALVAVRDGACLAKSPGVALLEPQGLIVGEAAAAAARLKPVLASDRFWSDLAADALAQVSGPPVSHADLAHAHLGQLWRTIGRPGDEVMLAVPGTMRPQQLGLALGIARSIAMPVTGIVDAAIAACACLPARAAVLHLDVQLHQSVLTEMRGASLLRRRRVEISARTGLKVMQAAWAQLVSEAMVRRTRFDPLHQAASEQQLFQRLPGWLDACSSQESIDVTIETGAGAFTATLHREQFALAAEAWYAQLIELVHAGRRAGESVSLALSARAAALPGLRDRLAALGDIELTTLPDEAAAAAAVARAAEIATGGAPALVTALQRSEPVVAGPGRMPRSGNIMRPTHVILAGRAHALDEHPLVLGLGAGDGGQAGRRLALSGTIAGISRSHCTLLARDSDVIVRDHSRFGTFVNGERVEGEAVLVAGDRLRLGTPGVVLELVAVA